MDVTAKLRAAARERFGWEELRPEQATAMRALMAGRDALVVAPTGGGKSAIYQVPGTLLEGPTLVVSPLLALQTDQIAGLAERDDEALAAVRLSSAERVSDRRAALEQLYSGQVEYVFVTPEQLADPEKLAAIRGARPSLVAVDEAHCISAWGYDFRPDYLQLGRAITELGHPPVVALTATASPPVREDIIDRLGLADPEVVVAGLDRPNILLEAVQCVDEDQRRHRLLDRLRESPPPGIVYVSTRRAAEELADWLTDAGIRATAYHGGMAVRERRRRHAAFLADEVPVMVATSAFGMGIDKPDIRWVNHVALPDSPDSYFQEIGRAGRDGEPAQALLLFRTEDTGLRTFFTGGLPAQGDLTRLAGALHAGPASRAALRETTGLGPRKLGELVALLEEVGAAVAGRGGKWRAPAYAPPPHQAAEAARVQAERRQAVQRSRLEMMRSLAETTACRGQVLLAYFGEHLGHPCGHCDNCLSGAAYAVEAASEDEPYPVHSRVTHPEWGEGTVLRYEGEQMTVLFDDVGYRTLSVPVVEERDLLTEQDRPSRTDRSNGRSFVPSFGYTLMCEQAGPTQLVKDAIRAEQAGFDFTVISDHYYPWLEEQGHAPYAWSVLGAVAYATSRMGLMSFVTSPIRRYHPAVVAQKAATIGVMSGGRFTLGLGAGENLNEHVVGAWPHVAQRHDMLVEALDIIRPLLAGETIHHGGEYFEVPEAKLWDLPDDPVEIGIAVSGIASCEIAGEYADAMIAVEPKRELCEMFTAAGGASKPRYGQVAICYGPDEAQCRKIAYEQFRWFGLGWPVNAELPNPRSFDSASASVREEDVAAGIPCGPDVDKHVDAVRKFLDAGFTHVALVQVGAEAQGQFLDFAERELLPALRSL